MFTTIRRAFQAGMLICVASAFPAAAQTGLSPTEGIEKALNERWPVVLAEVARRHDLRVEDNHLVGDAAQKKAAYAEAIDRLQRDPDVLKAAVGAQNQAEYERLVRERVRDSDRQYIEALKEALPGTPGATSTNSRSTNPAAGNLTERSGFAQFLALALDGSNVVSADDTAVSLNLSALALVSLADPDVYSELFRYQQHSFLRRIGGTVVFGAKVPEKEITGLSSLPDFDKLLDVFVWDVKVRLVGNRDPRDPHWYPLTLGRGGFNTQMAATIASLLPPGDFELASPSLAGVIDPADIKSRIARSPQLTLKLTGTLLTKEEGKNKFGGGLLFDTGLGGADLTANVLYTIVDDVSLGAEKQFQVKHWTFNAAVTGHIARDVLVAGKSVEWGSGVVFNKFVDKASLPIKADDTWKVFTSFDIPLSNTARVPVSIVYSNDPNALTKSKYVSGRIGISYDFTGLTTLFGARK